MVMTEGIVLCYIQQFWVEWTAVISKANFVAAWRLLSASGDRCTMELTGKGRRQLEFFALLRDLESEIERTYLRKQEGWGTRTDEWES